MVIFLDFDGVFHPGPPAEQGVVCRLDRFESVIGRYADLDVVLSTSWREIYPWAEITSFFSDDAQPCLIDKTPILPGADRYAEILAWLNQNQCHGTWVALDDSEKEFPSDCKQLCLCDTATGFDEVAVQRLASSVNQLNAPIAPPLP
jgi:hypothetical protein